MRWSRRSSSGRPEGVPRNPGAWLMAIAKRRGIDHFRRNKLVDHKHQQVGYEMQARQEDAAPDFDAALDDDVGDDLLRLIFTACHPVLSTEARVTLTLKLLAGLTDRGDRARVSRHRNHHPAAHRPRQAHARRQEGRLRSAERARADGAARLGARSHLPDFQRRLLGDRRRRLDAPGAVRGRAAPRPRARRAWRRTSPRCTAWSR